MIYRRERPKCRRLILNLLEKENLTLEELLHHETIFLSDNLKKQARKMIVEGQFKTAKELLKEQRREYFQRAVGMIR